MNKIYVLFTRTYPKNDGSYLYLPGFEIHSKKPDTKGPRDKVAELGVGECVDTFRCTLSEDETYVNCNLFTISNIDGKVEEKLTESFILANEENGYT